jgi:signal transduction histidine kinase
MSTRLVLGFCGSILIAMLALSLIVLTLMRARIYRTADEEMGWHARALQSIIQTEQDFMAEEATNGAALDGVDKALAAHDVAELKRLLSPSIASHNLNSAYVIDANRNVLLQLGEPMMADSSLVRLPLVTSSFTQTTESGFLDIDSSLWLGAAAPHRSPEGQTTGVIVLGKRLDQTYVKSLGDVVGTEVVLAWENATAYSFQTPPPELPLSHLQASLGMVAEYHDVGAYHSMGIGSQPYRVAGFSFPTRPSGQLMVFLLEPANALDESVQQALLGVAGLSLLIMLVGAPLIFLYARRVIRPLDRLTGEARRIAGGDLNRRVQVESEDEVGQLARAFEEMRVQVQAMLQAQMQWNVELEGKVRAKTGELKALLDIRDQLLHETLMVQEGERRRVARELHDETCQSLTALLANIATAQLLPPEQARARLPQFKATVVDTLKEVNRIVFALRPALLDDYGLMPALSWYAEQRLSTETKAEITAVGDEVRLPAEVETILFRVGQEAISNIAKYAGAHNVRINLTYTNGSAPPSITLNIEDDGCGFDLEHAESYSREGRRHMGLLGMRERLAQVGGNLDIRTSPGQGTTIRAVVPLESGPTWEV